MSKSVVTIFFFSSFLFKELSLWWNHSMAPLHHCLRYVFVGFSFFFFVSPQHALHAITSLCLQPFHSELPCFYPLSNNLTVYVQFDKNKFCSIVIFVDVISPWQWAFSWRFSTFVSPPTLKLCSIDRKHEYPHFLYFLLSWYANH